MAAVTQVPVEDLYFDHRNPRLVEFEGITEATSEDAIIKVLWDAMDVKEIVMSIAASGYFTHEPLICAIESSKKMVIEGNRRLAAVKIILNPSLIAADLPSVSDKIKSKIATLPVVQMTPEEAWQFIGFKHVNGPAKWNSYAKARYISRVHNDYEIPLDDIAEQIGDTHGTVQRLYRGLMVIQQAEQETNFRRDDTVRRHFAFSHIYTGLQYKGFSSYLSLRDEEEDTTEFVPKEKLENLEEVLLWLYGSKKADIEPIIQSENPDLRQLEAVLQHTEAVAALGADGSLAKALELTIPRESLFEEELFSIKRGLVHARGLATEGFDGSDPILDLAKSISRLAQDLNLDLENIRKRMKEESV